MPQPGDSRSQGQGYHMEPSWQNRGVLVSRASVLPAPAERPGLPRGGHMKFVLRRQRAEDMAGPVGGDQAGTLEWWHFRPVLRPVSVLLWEL